MTTLIEGTAGAETLTGTTRGDLILGYGGNDRLNGLAGDDTLDGGSGANQIDAGDGNDLILVDGTASSSNVYIPATGIDGGAGIDTIQFAGTIADYHIVNIVGYQLQVTDLTNAQKTYAINVEHLTFADGEIWLVPKPNTPATVGGDQFGAVSEDGVLVAQGQLTVADPDAGEAGFVAASGIGGAYGSLSLTATGSWTYQLDNNALAVQQLAAGEVITELLTVQTIDGTAAQIAIEITGAADTGLVVGTAGADRLVGTSGDDRLFGLGGDDRLNGKGGNDVLSGGDGADRFIFTKSFGQDAITDFATGQAGEVIDLTGISGLRNFADLAANHLSEVGGNAVLTFGASTLVLEGVAAASLGAGDFLC